MEDNISLLYAVGIYVVCLALMFINYGSFASTVVRWSKEPVIKKGTMKISQPTMSFKESLKCYAPAYQVYIVRKTLYNRVSIPMAVIIYSSVIGIILNIVNKFLFTINSYVMFAFNIVMLVSILLFYVSYAVVTADCAHMYGFGWLCVVLCFLFPHISCWYLHNNIPRKMRALHHERIFHEHSKDTVIRQKHIKH